MPDQEEIMQRVTTIQARYTETLMRKKYVVGVAAGLRKRSGQVTDEVCLVVMVEKKVPQDQLDAEDRIPEEIDGVHVDIQETGMFRAQSDDDEDEHDDDSDDSGTVGRLWQRIKKTFED
jgi:hypothetical protein